MLDNLLPPPLDPLLLAGCVWLFSDYDGTLAEFVPNPDVVVPRQEVVDLVSSLTKNPHCKVAIISGRRLSHTHALLPIPGLILAGTYGVELETPDGEIHHPEGYNRLRPALDRIKTYWEGAIAGKNGFYLEDKGFAIALHAKFATDTDAQIVLSSAEKWAKEDGKPDNLMILDGHRFLEVAPRSADKGKTVRHILESYPIKRALPIYLGDDDKDESGFEAVNEAGGMSILVAEEPRETQAHYRLENPRQVRFWLSDLDSKLREVGGETAIRCGQ